MSVGVLKARPIVIAVLLALLLSITLRFGVARKAFAAGPLTFEGENTTHTGASSSTSSDWSASGGAYLQTNGAANGNYVQYTINVPTSGTYDVEFGYKMNTGRGKVQLSVDGSNLGGTVDQYASASAFVSKNLGSKALSSGTHTFRFTINGKNASSSSYDFTVDYIKLVSGNPTNGYTEVPWDSSSYTVQNRTNGTLDQRFSINEGVYTTQVYAGEERVEMRWDTWADQTITHMWSADVYFEPVTNHTAIMQVKSNDGYEPIYIQVTSDGTIRNDGDSTPLATNMAGKWFNLKCAYNPTTGDGSIWINDVLVKTIHQTTPSRAFYFKNGTYDNGITSGTYSEAHFKDFHFYEK